MKIAKATIYITSNKNISVRAKIIANMPAIISGRMQTIFLFALLNDFSHSFNLFIIS